MRWGFGCRTAPHPSPLPRRPALTHSPLSPSLPHRDREAPPGISVPRRRRARDHLGARQHLAVTPSPPPPQPAQRTRCELLEPRRAAGYQPGQGAVRQPPGLPLSARMPPVTGSSLPEQPARGSPHRAAPRSPHFLHLPPRGSDAAPAPPSALGSLQGGRVAEGSPEARAPVHGGIRRGGSHPDLPRRPVPGASAPARPFPHPGRSPLPCCSTESPGRRGSPLPGQLLGSYLFAASESPLVLWPLC